jgi:2-haloacid dehalogenase
MAEPARIRAVTFDCYGTLIDWDTGISNVLGPWAVANGVETSVAELLGLFAEWQYHHQRIRPAKLYRDVVGDAFADAAARLGVRLADADREALAASVGTWPAFPDTIDGLRALKRRGLRLGVVSNVDNASFEGTCKLLGNLIDVVVTAEDVGAYKPDEEMFEALFEAFADDGIGKDAILHAAQSRFHDVAPANELGLDAVWVDRRAGRAGRGVTMPSDAEPTARVESLGGLVELFDAR